MKRILLILAAALTLAACSARDSSSRHSGDIDTVMGDYQADIKEIQETKYTNLDLSKAVFVQPEFESLHTIRVSSLDGDDILSAQEMYDNVQKWSALLFDDYDKDNIEIRIRSNMDDEDPKASENMELIRTDKGDVCYVMYRDRQHNRYLWQDMWNRYPHWINCGKALEAEGVTEWVAGGQLPSDTDRESGRSFYTESRSDEKHRLFSSEVTIGEAVRYLEKDYLSFLGYDHDKRYTLKVNEVSIRQLNAESSAYILYYTPAWDGIPFDSIEEMSMPGGDTTRFGVHGEALVTDKNEIDVIVGLQLFDVEELDSVDTLIPLSAAFDKASSELTDQVKFEVLSARLVYSGKQQEESAELSPFWKITLFNPNDLYNYVCYVDAQSGDFSYLYYLSEQGEAEQ